MSNHDDRTSDSVKNIKSDKTKGRKFDLISLLLLLLGVTLLALGIYFLVEPRIQNKKQDAASEELLVEVENNAPNPTITFRSNQLIVHGEEGQEETFFSRRPVEDEGGSAVTGHTNSEAETNSDIVTVYGMGTLRIPGIDLVIPLANNTDTYSLRVAVGHYPSSALPHQAGTGVYFGHRMIYYGRFFNRLNEVGVGSSIHIDYQGNRYTYIVDDNYIVPVDDLASIVFREDTEEQRILLITCHPLNAPIGQSPERILVEAYLKDISALQ